MGCRDRGREGCKRRLLASIFCLLTVVARDCGFTVRTARSPSRWPASRARSTICRTERFPSGSFAASCRTTSRISRSSCTSDPRSRPSRPTRRPRAVRQADSRARRSKRRPSSTASGSSRRSFRRPARGGIRLMLVATGGRRSTGRRPERPPRRGHRDRSSSAASRASSLSPATKRSPSTICSTIVEQRTRAGEPRPRRSRSSMPAGTTRTAVMQGSSPQASVSGRRVHGRRVRFRLGSHQLNVGSEMPSRGRQRSTIAQRVPGGHRAARGDREEGRRHRRFPRRIVSQQREVPQQGRGVHRRDGRNHRCPRVSRSC